MEGRQSGLNRAIPPDENQDGHVLTQELPEGPGDLPPVRGLPVDAPAEGRCQGPDLPQATAGPPTSCVTEDSGLDAKVIF